MPVAYCIKKPTLFGYTLLAFRSTENRVISPVRAIATLLSMFRAAYSWLSRRLPRASERRDESGHVKIMDTLRHAHLRG